MKYLNALFGLLTVIILLGCEPELILGKDEGNTDPWVNLDYLWNEVNDRYSYFELKGIDWEAQKAKYESFLFEEISDDSLFKVLGAMLTELNDAHSNLSSDFNISFFDIDKLGQDNYNWRTIKDNYLPDDFYISGPFVHDFVANGQIGYIRFPSYSGAISIRNLDFALQKYKETKGLILDLRENGGGAVTDVFELLSRFIDKKTLVYYSRLKTGPGEEDFSDPEPAYVSPNEGTTYLKKVIVLIDRGTYSAGSFTSLAIKAIPNMLLMGDTTGGGLGLPNGGQLPNGWTYRFSVTQALTLDMDESFENGVPPDVVALFDWSDLTKDEVLDRAIAEILE